MRERDIEKHLIRRVCGLGGEVRKVQWIGHKGAPDRLVMLPHDPQAFPPGNALLNPPRTIWVELKRPGLKATFPKDAHERAQHREHERMRAMGQRVEVIDSIEGVDEALR